MSTPRQGVSTMLAFLLTGVGSAALGATLPAALREWHLSDASGGTLLLAAWGGSTVGATLATGSAGSAALGLLLSSMGLWRLSSSGLKLLWPWYLLFGVGLGITMTSLSTLRSREVDPGQADIELNRLNLLWALGACTAPLLAFRSLRLLRVGSFFQGLGIFFLLFSLLVLVFARAQQKTSVPFSNREKTKAALPWAPLRFGLFAAAAVGLESSIGSWLSTYTERQTHGITTAVSANAAFWAGLLVSRAAHSVQGWHFLHTRAARTAHLAFTGVALALLLMLPRPELIPLAAFLCGAGLGPLYPLVLAVALPCFRSTALFVLAGLGSSLVPWLAGVLSSHSGSLRVGLLAAVAAFVLLLGSGFALRHEAY